jgi:hypothetical protein
VFFPSEADATVATISTFNVYLGDIHIYLNPSNFRKKESPDAITGLANQKPILHFVQGHGFSERLDFYVSSSQTLSD